jgi:hypothetical protein
MDTGGFAMYTDTVLAPWWEKQKASWSGEGPFPAKRLLVVCDNASVHKGEELREKLEQHGIILRFLPPNMTAWLQPLDLVVCGLIKTLQRARRGRHLARNLKEWKQKQDQIIGAAHMANKTPPPLEPWRPPNPTLMEGIFFYQQTHEGELQQKKTQDAIKKAFEDAGITPFKDGQWKQYVESSFLPRVHLPRATSCMRCISCSTKMPSVHISLT